MFNRFFAFLLLFILSLFILIILFLNFIFLKGSNPIFYQSRIGRNNIPFNIYKFKTINDDDVNYFGKFLRVSKLDELLQLFNILNGTMVFIGPRPELIDKAQSFANIFDNYNQRHLIKPGITGWAQIHFPDAKADDVALKLPLDIYYVKNKSIKLDLIIIRKTFYIILNRLFNDKT
jgi:lipopolysaccharide/colanic/teichoic acid biosynthesis glycosyltransferase